MFLRSLKETAFYLDSRKHDENPAFCHSLVFGFPHYSMYIDKHRSRDL